MRTFKKFPKEKKCIVCGTNEDKECVLIAKVGTGDNPNKEFQNYECEIVHLDCLDLWYDENNEIIYQRVFKKLEDEKVLERVRKDSEVFCECGRKINMREYNERELYKQTGVCLRCA